MKTTAALLLTLSAAMPALSQEDATVLGGSYEVTKVGQMQTPDNVQLTFSFDDDGQATLAMKLDGQLQQSVNYTYTIEDEQITLEVINPVGDATPVEYDVRHEDETGEIHLLRPLPEPPVVEDEEAEEAPADADADVDADVDADATEDAAEEVAEDAVEDATEDADESTEAEVEAETEAEPDTREPEWVLKVIPAS